MKKVTLPEQTLDFQSLFARAPGLYVVLAPDTHYTIISVSDAYAETAMVKRDEILGRSLFEVFPQNPDDMYVDGEKNLRESLLTVLKERIPHSMGVTRYDIRKPESQGGGYEERFWKPVNWPVLGGDGEVIAIVNHSVDVTDLIQSNRYGADQHTLNDSLESEASERRLEIHNHKEADEKLVVERAELRESERVLSQFIRLSPVPMVVYSGSEHVYSMVNEAYVTMLGKDVLGQTIRQVFPDKEENDIPSILDGVYRTGDPYVSKEAPYIIKGEDGLSRSIWIDEWFYPIRNTDAGQGIIGILGTSQDVTLHVLAREELARVLNSLPVLISRVNIEERFIFVNKINEKSFGPREKILGKTMQEFFGDKYAAFKDSIVSALHGEKVEFEWVSSPDEDGMAHQYIANFAPDRNADGRLNGFIICLFNIDELKLAEKKLKDAINVRDDFLSIASHEMKTPITSLKLQLLVTKKSIQQENISNPKTQKLLKSIEVSLAQVDRLTRLINDLLDASKIHAGFLSVRFEVINLTELANELVERLDQIAAESKCTIELKVKSQVIGFWDKSRIEQIIINLVLNAIKYAPGKPIIISVWGDNEYGNLSVQDFGPGIPLDKQEIIFKKFERADASKNVGGLGLGLFIVSQIVNAHGGTIRGESEVGQGSKFTIRLPLNPSYVENVTFLENISDDNSHE